MVYTVGAEKYEPNNWRDGYPWSRSIAALERHFKLFKAGESRDPKDGQHHLASVVFHALALMEWEKTKPGEDDRDKRPELVAALRALIERSVVHDAAPLPTQKAECECPHDGHLCGL